MRGGLCVRPPQPRSHRTRGSGGYRAGVVVTERSSSRWVRSASRGGGGCWRARSAPGRCRHWRHAQGAESAEHRVRGRGAGPRSLLIQRAYPADVRRSM